MILNKELHVTSVSAGVITPAPFPLPGTRLDEQTFLIGTFCAGLRQFEGVTSC